MQSAYNGKTVFHCLDGSAILEVNQINDDYCDCEDGSDEPGIWQATVHTDINDRPRFS